MNSFPEQIVNGDPGIEGKKDTPVSIGQPRGTAHPGPGSGLAAAFDDYADCFLVDKFLEVELPAPTDRSYGSVLVHSWDLVAGMKFFA